MKHQVFLIATLFALFAWGRSQAGWDFILNLENDNIGNI